MLTPSTTTREEMQAEIARLKAELKQTGRGLTFKVGEKGGLSVYGLGRFPVTLYKEQWARLFAEQDQIKAALVQNDAALKAKAA